MASEESEGQFARAATYGFAKFLFAPFSVAVQHLQLPMLSPMIQEAHGNSLFVTTHNIRREHGWRLLRGPVFGIIFDAATYPTRYLAATTINRYMARGRFFADQLPAPSGASFAERSRRYLNWVLGGSVVGIVSAGVMFPFGVIENCLTLDIGWTKYTGTSECIRQLMESGGIFRFYSGYVIAPIGVVLYRALYYGLHLACLPVLNKLTDRSYVSDVKRMAITSGVVFVSGVVCYPLDTISRMMTVTGCSVREAVGSIYKQFGLTGFFNGFVSSTINGFLCSAFLFGLGAWVRRSHESSDATNNLLQQQQDQLRQQQQQHMYERLRQQELQRQLQDQQEQVRQQILLLQQQQQQLNTQ